MSAPDSAELGSTTDPVALVPGTPGKLLELAADFDGWAKSLDETAQSLKGVRIEMWQGESATAFWQYYDPIPKTWITASDSMESASKALTAHAHELESAQAKAQKAIDTWNEGDAATEQSHRDYDAARERYLADPRGGAGGIPHFRDAGEPIRHDARELLQEAREAREAVEASGEVCAVALAGASGGSYTQSETDTTGAEGSWSWGDVTSDQWKDQWGSGRTGEPTSPSLGLSAVVASVNGAAWVWQTEGSFVTPTSFGDGQIYGDESISVLSADGTGSVGFGASGLAMNADAAAEILGVEATGGYRNDYLHGSVTGEAGLGAYGEGEASVTTEGLEVEGELFAGARASIEEQATFGGIGIESGVEGWAGAGVGGGAEFNFEDGAWHVGASFGAAWGLGGEVSVGLVVDPAEMARTGGNLVDAVTGWWS